MAVKGKASAKKGKKGRTSKKAVPAVTVKVYPK